ncbi:MAG: ATP-binding protein [Acidimicrobiia bacterium]
MELSHGRLRITRLLRPWELQGPTNERVLRSAQRIRLGVALAFAVAIPFAPGFALSERLSLSALTIAYALLSALLELIAARRPGFPAGVVTPVVGMATIFAVAVVLPEAETASLFFYVLGITFYTCIGGLTLGLWLSAVVVPCAVTANALAPRAERVDAFTLVMFALLLPSLVFIVEGLTRERRRTAARLARLYDALRAVTGTPDLQATLDSIVASIRDAVGATAAGILLREDDHLVVAAPSGATSAWSSEEVQHYTSRELALGDGSPLGRAMARNEVVVVPDVHDDERFPRWAKRWGRALRQYGFASLVAVPLRLGDDVIGVLNAVFSWPGAVDDADQMLLEAYAERTASVIVRAQAYERERAAAEQLAEADRLKSEFLALVSHELRTPLTAVKGFVDTVLLHWDRLPDDERRALLTRASGNADELTRLVGQLLDFARMDADRVEIRPQRLHLATAVDAVLQDLAPVLAAHQVGVEVDDALAVVADADAFGHVLVNLLTNAVKFSPPGSRVGVTAHAAGDEIVIGVSDEGVGVAPEDQARIFERFYQSNAPVASRRGTGIGLAIARRFAELHGGRIWVESEPGLGSTFSFTLPAGQASPRADVTRGEAAAS